MQITLYQTPEEWLLRQVAAGRFSSVDVAVAASVAMLRDCEPAGEDLEWAVPLVSRGLAELDRGEALPGGEALDDVRQRLGFAAQRSAGIHPSSSHDPA